MSLIPSVPRLLRAGCLVTALVALAIDARSEAAPKPDAAEIKRLVDDLGADEFAAREAATEQLTRIGLPAYKAVEDAVQHNDREIRYRAERILGRIRQSDLQRRLDAFLRGSEATDDYQLPGWTRFKKSFGDDSHSRAVFVDLTKADAELLQALENNPKGIGEVVSTRVTQYQQMMQQFGGISSLQQLNFGQIAALVFVAGEEELSLNPTQAGAIFNFCNQQAMSEAVSSGNRREIPRQLLARVIIRSEDWAAYSAMTLAKRFNMKEGLVPAVKILKGNRQPHMAMYALATVATMGDDSHLPMVEKLLTDTNLIMQMQEKDKVSYKVEVRDAALAAAIFLTKQDLKDYFTPREGQTIGEPQSVLSNPRIIGFAEEAKRAEVFKKWAAYREKNPLPPAEKPKDGEATDDKPAADKPAAEKPAEK